MLRTARWFLGAPFESLKRGNIKDFIAYGFYCQRPGDLAPEVRSFVSLVSLAVETCCRRPRVCRRQLLRALLWAVQVRRQLSEYITRIEAVWGVRFEEGRTPGLRFMAHLWEDLRYVWKPMAVRPGSRTVLKAFLHICHALQCLPAGAGKCGCDMLCGLCRCMWRRRGWAC